MFRWGAGVRVRGLRIGGGNGKTQESETNKKPGSSRRKVLNEKRKTRKKKIKTGKKPKRSVKPMMDVATLLEDPGVLFVLVCWYVSCFVYFGCDLGSLCGAPTSKIRPNVPPKVLRTKKKLICGEC